MIKKHLSAIIILVMVFLVPMVSGIGCSGGEFYFPSPTQSPTTSPSPSPGDVTPPTVKSVDPADGSVDVEPTSSISVTFSEDMDESTLNDANVKVTGPFGQVEGAVAKGSAATNAVFSPAKRLALLNSYTVSVLTGAKDVSGNSMASEFSSSFTIRDGVWGTPELVETDDSGSADNPHVAVDPYGNAMAIWFQSDGVNFNIYSRRYTPGSGWGTVELVETDNAGHALNPRVAVDPSGNAVAVWFQFDGTRYSVYSNRYIVGSGWGTAGLIENSSENVTSGTPQVAVDSLGNAIAVWTLNDGTRNNVWSNRYTVGSGWGTARLLENDTNDLEDPRIAVDPSGNGLAVWSQYDGTRFNIWSNRYTAGSGWGTPELVETDTGNANSPDIAIDSSGNATAVWSQLGVSMYSIWSNRYVPGSGWGTQVLIETDETGHAYIPRLAVDAEGNAVTVWHQYDGSNFNVCSNRYTVDSGWGTAELIETNNGSAYSPKVAVDPSGNAIAVWHQADPIFYQPNVWSNRYVSGSGWGTAQLLETDDAGIADKAEVAIDTSGVAYVVWRQELGGLVTDILSNIFQ